MQIAAECFNNYDWPSLPLQHHASSFLLDYVFSVHNPFFSPFFPCSPNLRGHFRSEVAIRQGEDSESALAMNMHNSMALPANDAWLAVQTNQAEPLDAAEKKQPFRRVSVEEYFRN